ncbi:MAG: hypothetical protein II714_02650 [Oscillospiraceae bacterium]|nr:hypothetical protein [Oscillospiraceae bacterium]
MKYPAKRAAVFLLLPCLMILCGFGEKVELLDQTKLIDLDKAICKNRRRQPYSR